MSNADMVREFHAAFGVPAHETPTIPSARRRGLRMDLMLEELSEVYSAIASEDVAQIAKELADLLYVVYGTAHEFGVPIDAVFAEVHRSNMTKLGRNGKPVRRDDGKILKGPDYEAPRLAEVLA